MRKILFIGLFLIGVFTASASSVSGYSWAQICAGKVTPEAWYASAEARGIADTVIAVQKTNGGWMKNDQLHMLSEADYQRLVSEKNGRSCLDNYATMQEMRFLAKVWKAGGSTACQSSFMRALQMILSCQKGCGGWSQYYPLSNDNGYQDYITFNDDLMTNVMRLLRDVYENKGDFAEIADSVTRSDCRQAFDKGLRCIMECQIDDNGTPAAWCAQHDTVAPYLPTEGRPHELPSVSGYESANLLSFLMSITNPTEELKQSITAAVSWLDIHKIENKAVESFTNANGEPDRHVVDQPGTHLWGRFIQIGGQSGTIIYNKLFNKLGQRGKRRSYTYNGVTYTYTEEEIARTSYDPSKAYQPIYAIYKDTIQHMYYRFLYNYEDTPKQTDSKGCPVYTSLLATNRANYQYLGSWCQRVIEVEYPAWKKRYEPHSEGDYILSSQTYVSGDAGLFTFDNAVSISNNSGKRYAAGQQNTIKYSADVLYSIVIPYDLQVEEAEITGYNNYADADANLVMWNEQNYSAPNYVFQAKDNGDPQWVTYYMNHTNAPVTDFLRFMIGGRQTCLKIKLSCKHRSDHNAIPSVAEDSQKKAEKRFENGHIVIIRNGRKFSVLGQNIDK